MEIAGEDIKTYAMDLKKANINQSLIYHHFKSKEDLWICVKKYCVEKISRDDQSLRHDTLENFVHDLVSARLTVYENSFMRMLVHWQALEADPSKFYEQEEGHHQPFNILPHVRKLQKDKLIRSDQDAQVLSGIIFSLTSYAFFDFAAAYKLTKKQLGLQKTLIVEVLIDTLKP